MQSTRFPACSNSRWTREGTGAGDFDTTSGIDAGCSEDDGTGAVAVIGAGGVVCAGWGFSGAGIGASGDEGGIVSGDVTRKHNSYRLLHPENCKSCARGFTRNRGNITCEPWVPASACGVTIKCSPSEG